MCSRKKNATFKVHFDLYFEDFEIQRCVLVRASDSDCVAGTGQCRCHRRTSMKVATIQDPHESRRVCRITYRAGVFLEVNSEDNEVRKVSTIVRESTVNAAIQ